jgi:hypothetical protein
VQNYDAFISYTHAKDMLVASRLQSQMQRLGSRGIGGVLCAFSETIPAYP